MINNLKNNLKMFYVYRVIKKSGVFDREYYLKNNLDVARDCVDPIKHYLQHGWREARDPNLLFDTKWYMETYQDVRESGINPLYHYIKYGSKENRDPSATFSAIDYVVSHPDILTGQINPIAYARRKNYPQFLLSPLPLDLFNLQPVPFPHRYKGKQVSIIVPIHNAYIELKKLLQSIYDNSDIPFKLIAIDDASTEPKVSELLKSCSKRYDNFTHLQNAENLGFIRTVNKGLKTTIDSDCVIINTDVEVPQNWLSRLFYPLWTFDNIASVTPMSNSATLMSFPKFDHNDLPEGLSLQQIDDIFNKLNPEKDIYIETVTGHGFCMAMSHKVIKEIGVFDTVYGKGYGEENDWCMKALMKGYRNLIAVNVFLYHKHTTSFNSRDREKYVKKNDTILKKRYPDYDKKRQITAFDQKYRDIRKTLLLLTTAAKAKKCVLRFENTLSGGSSLACFDYIKDKKNEDLVLIIRPFKKDYTLDAHYNDYHTCFALKSEEDIVKLSNLVKIDKIIINQLVGYCSLRNIFSAIETIKKNFNTILELNVRDFFCVCPQYNLMCMGEKFCNLEYPENCEQCYFQAIKVLKLDDVFQTIEGWRSQWSKFLCSVDRIIVFSNFTKSMLTSCYPQYENKVIVSTIPVNYLRKVVIKKTSNIVNIAVLGNINYVKGSEILKQMLNLIRTNKNINLFLFGKTNDYVVRKNIIYKGEYNREHLPYLMEQNRISIIFIPSICGETFSRTAQEAISMDIPLAVFDIGAPPERVRKYKKGLVIKKMNAECALSQMVEFVKKLPND